MIYGKSADGKTILVGLSKRNIDLLQQGKPIRKDLPGMPALIVCYGETELEIVKQLAELQIIDERTIVRGDPR